MRGKSVFLLYLLQSFCLLLFIITLLLYIVTEGPNKYVNERKVV